MKRGTVIVVLALLAISLGGASANAEVLRTATPPEWQKYTSSVLGLSFDYPSGWTIDAPTFVPGPGKLGYSLALVPDSSGSQVGSKIEVIPQYFEYNEGQPLASWVEQSYRTSPFFRDPPTIEILDTYQLTTAPDNVSQVVHLRASRPGSHTESIWLSNGRLVYTFMGYAASDAMSDVLEGIVATVQFAPDAPRSLNDLYDAQQAWPTLEDTIVLVQDMWEQAENIPNCDIVCRDAEASQGIENSSGPTYPPSQEFLEQERLYREHLEETGPPPGYEDATQTSGAMPDGQVLDDRKALPSNWWSPIQITGTATKNADCSSLWHGGPNGGPDSAMAIDIQGVSNTTSVFAAQTGTVATVGWDQNGYGNYVIINSTASVAGQNRTYQHLYAHLSRVDVAGGNPATRGVTHIGVTGNTGGTSTGFHLHFHVRYGNNPVDLSPLVGFTPKLGYPLTQSCGTIEDKAVSPLIIEPVMFTQRQQPRRSHYWFCYPDQAHTTECYMYGVPNDRSGWDPLITLESPELRYSNVYVPTGGTYYIWTCGWGGSYEDDSVHMGYSDALQPTSDRISFFHPNYWRWSGHTMDIVNGSYEPARFTSVASGDRIFNVWMREDGLRIDRILLTRSSTFPIATIRCGGY